MSIRTQGSTGGESDYIRVSSHDSQIRLGAGEDIAFTAPSEKICCICGEDVAGKPRMKDHAGQYWCYECGMADQQKKQQSLAGVTTVHPASKPFCPECQQEMSADQLTEFGGRRICADCMEKLERSARREAARLAAAEEEAARMARNHRTLMIVITAVAIAAVLLAVWRLVRM